MSDYNDAAEREEVREPMEVEIVPSTEGSERCAQVAAAPPNPLVKVDPAYHALHLVGSWIFAIGLTVGLATLSIACWILSWIGPQLSVLPLLGLPLVAGAICWFSHSFAGWSYERYRYRLGSDGLDIHRGVFWRRVTTVPLSRVQHTDVNQGPLQRHFNLATVTIHTAGTENAAVGLDGLRYEDALAVRDFLISGGNQ